MTQMLVPMGFRVIVFPDPVEELTSGGIALPQSVKDREQRATKRGTLISKGPDVKWGVEKIEDGTKVWYRRYTGDEVEWPGAPGKLVTVINDEDITAAEMEVVDD